MHCYLVFVTIKCLNQYITLSRKSWMCIPQLPVFFQSSKTYLIEEGERRERENPVQFPVQLRLWKILFHLLIWYDVKIPYTTSAIQLMQCIPFNSLSLSQHIFHIMKLYAAVLLLYKVCVCMKKKLVLLQNHHVHYRQLSDEVSRSIRDGFHESHWFP